MENPSTSSLLGSVAEPPYVPTGDEKNLAMLAHLLAIVAPLLAPLIIYLMKKGESKFVEYHARESLNFQITLVIICLVLVISIVGILLLWVVCLISLVLVIVAGVRASESKLYRYPFCIRLIK